MEARRRLGIGSGLVVGVALVASAPALAEQFQCRLGEGERRVELSFAEGPDRLPCEVLYWRNVTEESEPEVLWRAETNASFCVEKTQDLIARLENGGWRCTAEGTQAANGQAEPRTRGDDRRTEAAPPERSAEPAAPEREQTNGQDATEQRRAVLGEAIARDLDRLNQLTASATGEFSMDMAKLGDLDRDGADDAAVIMTYRAGSDVAYYLLAYLFDGSAFRPAAKTYLGGSAQNLQVSEIETIDDGAIRVRFQETQGGATTAAGREGAAFVLEDGELIEAPTS